MEPHVLGFEDDTHPATTEFFENAIVGNRAAENRGGISHRRCMLRPTNRCEQSRSIGRIPPDKRCAYRTSSMGSEIPLPHGAASPEESISIECRLMGSENSCFWKWVACGWQDSAHWERGARQQVPVFHNWRLVMDYPEGALTYAKLGRSESCSPWPGLGL